MKNFKGKLEQYKNRKEFINELEFYKEFILKKLEIEDFNSALNKVRSALILIQEAQEEFDVTEELVDFLQLNRNITDELQKNRNVYIRRFNNLLKEDIDESNLENLMKLLAMLKEEVDPNVEKFNLEDIQSKINKYFESLKNLYTILGCWKILNYDDVLRKILLFGKELESKNFPNLKKILQSIYQKLLKRRLFEISKGYERLPISEMTTLMKIDEEDLIKLIYLTIKQKNNPIKKFDAITQEVVFNKKSMKINEDILFQL